MPPKTAWLLELSVTHCDHLKSWSTVSKGKNEGCSVFCANEKDLKTVKRVDRCIKSQENVRMHTTTSKKKKKKRQGRHQRLSLMIIFAGHDILPKFLVLIEEAHSIQFVWLVIRQQNGTCSVVVILRGQLPFGDQNGRAKLPLTIVVHIRGTFLPQIYTPQRQTVVFSTTRNKKRNKRQHLQKESHEKKIGFRDSYHFRFSWEKIQTFISVVSFIAPSVFNEEHLGLKVRLRLLRIQMRTDGVSLVRSSHIWSKNWCLNVDRDGSQIRHLKFSFWGLGSEMNEGNNIQK